MGLVHVYRGCFAVTRSVILEWLWDINHVCRSHKFVMTKDTQGSEPFTVRK